MAKVFVFDFATCNGCHNCQVACKDEHCEQSWPPYAEAQPLTGQFWLKLSEKVRGQVPVVQVSYMAEMCNHCADAPCMKLGGDAVYRRDDGLVIIDPAKAKGMKELVDSCPVGAIFWNEELELPQKCTGCAHLLDNGWEEPRCTDACPTEALRFVEESSIDLSRASTLDALLGAAPKMYYLNMPKRFIAGTYVNILDDEVVIGARVDLISSDGTLVASQETDEFGDFKFDQVGAGVYTVLIGDRKAVADVMEVDRYIGIIDASA